MHIISAVRGTALWSMALEQVRRRYAQVFDAVPSSDPDCFVVAYEPANRCGGTGTVRSSVGLTFGVDRPFFCERYLSGRAEDVLRAHMDQPCERTEIVEVGPLAAESAGDGAELITILPTLVRDLGRRYGVMTVTRQLIALLRRIGYSFEPIAAARSDRLPPAERRQWGTYYQQAPQTGLIRIERLVPTCARAAGRYRPTRPEYGRATLGRHDGDRRSEDGINRDRADRDRATRGRTVEGSADGGPAHWGRAGRDRSSEDRIDKDKERTLALA